jgi:hypothetical protein
MESYQKKWFAGCLSQRVEIPLNGVFQTQIKRIANERMANRHFIEVGNLLMEEPQVVQIKVMTGVNAKF